MAYAVASKISCTGVGNKEFSRNENVLMVTSLSSFTVHLGAPPSIANAKWENRVTSRVMSPSRRIDRFRAGRPRMKINEAATFRRHSGIKYYSLVSRSLHKYRVSMALLKKRERRYFYFRNPVFFFATLFFFCDPVILPNKRHDCPSYT